jgi:hypothetical protein
MGLVSRRKRRTYTDIILKEVLGKTEVTISVNTLCLAAHK